MSSKSLTTAPRGTGAKEIKMAQFQVSANGTDFGIYEADTEQDARDACAVDAGYDSEADMAAKLDAKSELQAVEVEAWEAWIDGQRSSAVEFHAPVGGTFDIAEAGAAALGIEVCEELNVQRV
jgi:hypothetical protein